MPNSLTSAESDVSQRCSPLRSSHSVAVRKSGRRSAGSRLCLARPASRRRHQDRQVTPDPGAAPALPRRCVEALREHRKLQAKDRLRAGVLWQDHGLVFASTIGTPLSANNVIRAFRAITEKAGLGRDWAPREMRHTFVSVLSANGVPIESIALLAGHDRTSTTELVYRHEIRPALTQGAGIMDKIFG